MSLSRTDDEVDEEAVRLSRGSRCVLGTEEIVKRVEELGRVKNAISLAAIDTEQWRWLNAVKMK